MSIYDNQMEKFGKTCRWLDCDCNCHMTKCVLNWAKREVLLERFKALNFAYPELYVEVFSDSCKLGEYPCFDARKKPENEYTNYDDDDYVTKLEEEALADAAEFLNDDKFVHQLYHEAKANRILKIKDHIAKENDIIKGLENDKI